MLRLAIVDDHCLVRKAFADILNTWPEGQVVVEAANGLEYEQRCAELGHVHLALVDLCMPVRDGYDTLAWIVRNQSRTRALAITHDPTPLAAQRVLRYGGRALLSKGIEPEELHRAMHQVHHHEFYYNEYVDRALRRKVEDEAAKKHPNALVASLTPRMLEFLLNYTAPGSPSIVEVGVLMGLKPTSAEKLRQDLVKRLGFSDRGDLVRFVLVNGLK